MSTETGVEFAQEPAALLLREGTLDPEWLTAYYALGASDGSDLRAWPPAYFQLRHFVSTYLPLRYRVWTRSAGRRNEHTEGQLAELVSATARSLWRGACEAARVGSAVEESAVVRLTLGTGNPLRLFGERRDEWDFRYRAALGELGSSWRMRSEWPRLEAMALHVASFYLPLGLPPSAGVPSGGAPRLCDRELLDDLAKYFHADVVQLIGCWVAAAGADRDEAGIPIVGWSHASDRRLTGRTESELLLLRASPGLA